MKRKEKNGMYLLKVQKPLSGILEPIIMLYNKNRTISMMLTYTEEWEKWFGDRLKVYAWFKANPKTKMLDFIRESKNQNPGW